MKTQTKQNILIAICLQAMLALVGCGSNNSNSTPSAATTGTLINGVCYVGSTPVAMSSCPNSGLQIVNNQCISTTTGQIYPLTSCPGYGSTGIGGTSATYCSGPYRTINGTNATGYCYGSNCSGWTLMSLTTGQVTTCM